MLAEGAETGLLYRAVADEHTQVEAAGVHVWLIVRTTESSEGHARRLVVLARQYATRLFSNHPDTLYSIEVHTQAAEESIVVSFMERALGLYARANGLLDERTDESLRASIAKFSLAEYHGMQRTLAALMVRERRRDGTPAPDEADTREFTHIVEFGADGLYGKTTRFTLPPRA